NREPAEGSLLNKSGVVVAGSQEYVLARHLYLSTCAHTVVLDTSRRKADAEAAGSQWAQAFSEFPGL
ncbi:hypothetical protein, partial [Klebsiella pneumoniae]|uniref:hypothetical protein n=1 Tax=Klebsiella pneumoniae TaxID=573 RepID=UPI001C64DDB7